MELAGEIFRELTSKEEQLIIEITDDKKEQATTHLSKYPVTPIEFPYLCTPQKATYALMAGFYIETMPHGTSHDNNKEA